jgi:hypothetical protein
MRLLLVIEPGAKFQSVGLIDSFAVLNAQCVRAFSFEEHKDAWKSFPS